MNYKSTMGSLPLGEVVEVKPDTGLHHVSKGDTNLKHLTFIIKGTVQFFHIDTSSNCERPLSLRPRQHR